MHNNTQNSRHATLESSWENIKKKIIIAENVKMIKN